MVGIQGLLLISSLVGEQVGAKNLQSFNTAKPEMGALLIILLPEESRHASCHLPLVGALDTDVPIQVNSSFTPSLNFTFIKHSCLGPSETPCHTQT